MSKFVCFNANGEKVPFEKSILREKCEYFRDCFDKNDDLFEIKIDASKKAIELFLRFVNDGNISATDLLVVGLNDLLDLAIQFKYKELVEFIVDGDCITFDNVAKIYLFAYRFDMNHVLIKCLNFLDENAQKIVANTGVFKTFPMRLVYDVISRNTFVVEELHIINALVEWRKANGKSDFSLLLKKVRLNLINKEDFYDKVLPLKLFTDDDYFVACVTRKFKTRSRKDINIDAQLKSFEDDSCYCTKFLKILSKIDTSKLETFLQSETEHYGQKSHLKDVSFYETIKQDKEIIHKAEVKTVYLVQHDLWSEISFQSSYHCVGNQSIAFEFKHWCEVNLVVFQLPLNYYYKSYEIFGGLEKNRLSLLRAFDDSNIYWGWQNVYFKPTRLKYIKISFPSSDRSEFESFRCEMNTALVINQTDLYIYSRKSWAKKFRSLKNVFPKASNDDIFALQHPCYVSQFRFFTKSINRTLDMRIETKANIQAPWKACENVENFEKIALKDGFEFVLNFSLRLVSFIRISQNFFASPVFSFVCSFDQA
ncbi:BTB/POZ domain-containing protein 9-like protein [Dinothrombium tinctorium]|uniref:BTB/POZ domain-containing protein 9-like protein n=1 Tax=Dinothrombium tinctorium TaxID=1965070 RepID=A0A443R6S9_9ACAR|nr:BTB/POZ domain-containing protein 9-like protein [Dinothrombium tinctorium]